MATVDMSISERGESLYRMAAMAQGEEPNWDGLSLDDQVMYMRVANLGIGVLEGLEGAPYEECAQALHRLSCDPEEAELRWQALPKAGRVVWEIIARHLAMLVDDVDDLDMGSAGAMWRDLYAKRMSDE